MPAGEGKELAGGLCFPFRGCPWAKGDLAYGVYSVSVLEMRSRSVGEPSALLSALLCLVQASLEALHSCQVTDFPGEPQANSHLT